ncbi:hypothetical protein [Elizabethkingia anophelis]|uniref:hypothetical protein n=1 Tax=Elizabethkingia anophelis TaxID=1117645 RepID=UPI00259AFAF7|nr:hypothetical protein [Elizabethkingia anophelis]WJK00015.1 hypothetical protein QTN78_18190 [Elizabethkingia anophelis]
MKKNLLIGAFALLGFVANAQTKGNFKLGTHIGIPTGELADVASFNIGIDMAYLFNIDTNFKAGFTTGYSHYFVKSITRNFLGRQITLVQKLRVIHLLFYRQLPIILQIIL